MKFGPAELECAVTCDRLATAQARATSPAPALILPDARIGNHSNQLAAELICPVAAYLFALFSLYSPHLLAPLH